jgi:hypothetical protein
MKRSATPCSSSDPRDEPFRCAEPFTSSPGTEDGVSGLAPAPKTSRHRDGYARVDPRSDDPYPGPNSTMSGASRP